MQGLELPTPSACSSSSLPPGATRPMLPPPLPPLSHVFVEPEDTTGQAVLRRVRPSLTTSTAVTTAGAPSISSTPPLAVNEVEVQTSATPALTEVVVVHNTLSSDDQQMSRTQKWRLLKSQQGEYDQGVPAPKRS